MDDEYVLEETNGTEALGAEEVEWVEPCAECETRLKTGTCNLDCEILSKHTPMVMNLGTDSLHPDPSQPRKTFDEEKLKGLAETLKTQGMLQPIAADETGRIVIGERRWRAAKLAGLNRVPVITRPEPDPLLCQAIADAHSESIPILEKAKAWQTLMDTRNLTKSGLAILLGMDKSRVTRVLSLNGMPKEMTRALENNRITPSDLMEIRCLPEEEQSGVFSECIEKERSRDEIMQLIKERRHRLISSLKKSGPAPFYANRPKDKFRRLGADIDPVNQNVIVTASNETMKHFIVKAMLFKLLREKGRRTGCEMEVGNGVADIVDLETKYAYEVESEPEKGRLRKKIEQFAGYLTDMIVIDLAKVPDDLNLMKLYLAGRIA